MKIKEIVDSINYTKEDLFKGDEKSEKFYKPYIVNKNFSSFADTIFFANEMNCNWELDKKMQYDFFRLGIRKKKRYFTWLKRNEDEKIELIKEAYGYNNQKAEQVLNILGPSDLDLIQEAINKGALNNKE